METNLQQFYIHESYNNHDYIPIANDIQTVPSHSGNFDESSTLRLWWRHVQQLPLLSSEREKELGERIRRGEETAYFEMVEGNLRLVACIAKKCVRFAGSSLTLEDLIQEGCMGLMRAVRKFDYQRGCRFSTYASYWIRQAIMRAIAGQGRSIRLPVHMVETISRTERAKVALTQQMQRPPSQSELSDHLGISEKKLAEMMKCINDSTSLDAPVNEDDRETSLVDYIKDDSWQMPDDYILRETLQGEVHNALKKLPKREATVLKMHFGLNSKNKVYSLDEIGHKLGVTRERVRQLERSAFHLLKTNASFIDMVSITDSPQGIQT